MLNRIQRVLLFAALSVSLLSGCARLTPPAIHAPAPSGQRVAVASDDATVVVDPPPPAELHPPYDASGGGSVSGELVAVVDRVYPAGSLQRIGPYPSAVVRWDDHGTMRQSEFILSYAKYLSVDGKTLVAGPTDRSIELVPSTLRSLIGRKILVDYHGGDLQSLSVASRDYPYATALRIVISK